LTRAFSKVDIIDFGDGFYLARKIVVDLKRSKNNNNKKGEEPMNNALSPRRTSPFSMLSNIQTDFDRLTKQLFDADIMPATDGFSPSCEIGETQNTYILKFDMPGIKKEDVKIELNDNKLTVSAERREEKKSEDIKFRKSEISYGSYERSFSFPTHVDEKKVDAKFQDGVLKVTLAKSEESKKKLITIQ
jgi:HSP20 family protein